MRSYTADSLNGWNEAITNVAIKMSKQLNCMHNTAKYSVMTTIDHTDFVIFFHITLCLSSLVQDKFLVLALRSLSHTIKCIQIFENEMRVSVGYFVFSRSTWIVQKCIYIYISLCCSVICAYKTEIDFSMHYSTAFSHAQLFMVFFFLSVKYFIHCANMTASHGTTLRTATQNQ